MAIREFSPEGTPRAKIAFVGELARSGGLGAVYKSGTFYATIRARRISFAIPIYAAQLDAVIWTQDPKKLNTLPRELRRLSPTFWITMSVSIFVSRRTTS